MSDTNLLSPPPATAGRAAVPAGGNDPVLSSGETARQALTRAQAAALALRYDEAAALCNDVLAIAPHHPDALASLGIILARAGNQERGIALLRRAIHLRPGIASWHANLATQHRITYKLDDALAEGQQAVRLEPESPDHLVTLALTHVDREEPDQAIACLLRALELKQDEVNAHLLLGEILLANGDFEPGWIEYEWRKLTDAGKRMMPALRSPYWNGMRIPKGRLLLFGDQGYGDMIHFARYIPMAAERCQEIALVCVPEMMPLLRHIPGVEQFCHRWDALPSHVAHCRLASLPSLFHTLPDTIPAKVPYLKADPARVAHWSDRLAAALPAGVKRIGLAWRGRPTHPNDGRRSLPLSSLIPLAEAGPAAFVSLQRPMAEVDFESVPRFPFMADLASEPMDFAETAAVMQNLDLIITVDTAMAHLAGALGRPVWIMLNRSADWRWQLNRSDSPWYPTARLFRQDKLGAWDGVIGKVRDALAGVTAPANPTVNPPQPVKRNVSVIGFYINLDRNPDRRAHMETELARHNLQDCYHRFAGADGNVLGLPNPNLTVGEIGCFTSHYLLLRQNLGCRSHIHVLEDDMVLSDVARRTVEHMTALNSLDGFDMIFTHTGLFEGDIIRYKRLFDQCKVVRNQSGKITSYKLDRIPFRTCTGSYVVNYRSIPKILSFYEEELHKGIKRPIDLFIRDKVEQGELRAVSLFPFVTTDLPRGRSVIDGRAGSATSRLIMDIVRRSFYIDRDLDALLREITRFIPYDETDIPASILSRSIHFLMTAEHGRF